MQAVVGRDQDSAFAIAAAWAVGAACAEAAAFAEAATFAEAAAFAEASASQAGEPSRRDILRPADQGWWALQDSNLRLPPCEDGTLPLS